MQSETADNNESYQGFDNSREAVGVIHLRLDTSNMLDQLEAFLRGTRLVGYNETRTGGLEPRYAPNGKPKMNDDGVQSLMSWLTLHLSPHTVQGNFKDEMYQDYICEFEIDLRQMIMTNLHNWRVKIEDYNTIVDGIMLTAQPFFSRTIDNKERESYAQTVRSSETHTVQDKPDGGFLTGILKR